MAPFDVIFAVTAISLASFVYSTMTTDENGKTGSRPKITNTRNYFNPNGTDKSGIKLEMEKDIYAVAFGLLIVTAILFFLVGLSGGRNGILLYSRWTYILKDQLKYDNKKAKLAINTFG